MSNLNIVNEHPMNRNLIVTITITPANVLAGPVSGHFNPHYLLKGIEL